MLGDSMGGEEEVRGDTISFGGPEDGGVVSVGGFRSSGVGGPEGTGGATGSSEGGGEVGQGGIGSSFWRGDIRPGGAGSSEESGDIGKGGAGDSGGGGEVGCEGAGSGGRSCSGDSSLKQTHMSPLSSPAGGTCSGPKMLSKSAIEGLLLEPSASVDTSETQ